MYNHFATALFVWVYSIRGYQHIYILVLSENLKTSLCSKEMNLLRRLRRQLPLLGKLKHP